MKKVVVILCVCLTLSSPAKADADAVVMFANFAQGLYALFSIVRGPANQNDAGHLIQASQVEDQCVNQLRRSVENWPAVCPPSLSKMDACSRAEFGSVLCREFLEVYNVKYSNPDAASKPQMVLIEMPQQAVEQQSNQVVAEEEVPQVEQAVEKEPTHERVSVPKSETPPLWDGTVAEYMQSLKDLEKQQSNQVVAETEVPQVK
ncbi:MAG: hypothetical protein K9M10_03935 [Candidatus Pacebacteria bacterium]|nr:hypothetical protein [Candidatus Paceibacterota bacterium]MCF7857598.1 hypothetical protein [Candidatus Paceibacterota bacterium]